VTKQVLLYYYSINNATVFESIIPVLLCIISYILDWVFSSPLKKKNQRKKPPTIGNKQVIYDGPWTRTSVALTHSSRARSVRYRGFGNLCGRYSDNIIIIILLLYPLIFFLPLYIS